MIIEVEFWQLVSLLIGFLGACAGAGKLFFAQVEKRLGERFEAMEKARTEGGLHWDERFSRIEAVASKGSDRANELEKDLLKLRAELPREYVRREDYVQGQSIIMARLDALAVKIENLALKGARYDA